MNDEPTPRQVFVGLLPTAGALYVAGGPGSRHNSCCRRSAQSSTGSEGTGALAAIADIERAKEHATSPGRAPLQAGLKVFRG